MNHTLAVILARGGSKGLPGKNGLPLAGKPVVQWTIDHVRATPGLDRVVLSTDAVELANIGKQGGIDVVHRPAELAGDHASVDDAVRFTVESVESAESQCHLKTRSPARAGLCKPGPGSQAPAANTAATSACYDQIVILYGNVPVRPAKLTRRALDKLSQSGADSVQSLTPVAKHHPYWMKTLGGEAGDRLGAFIDNAIDRRQDLPPVYGLDGGVIAVTRTSLFASPRPNAHSFLGNDRRAIVCQPGEVIDIDTAHDLHLAQAVLEGQ